MEKRVYDFTNIPCRFGTNSLKWDGLESRYGHKDLLSMWIADMDFCTPQFIIDALQDRLHHAVLGYSMPGEEWSKAIINWVNDRYNWKIENDWLGFIPGIVRGIAFVIKTFTNPNDKVMVMSPVYHPFFHVAEDNGRQPEYCPLIIKDELYYIDFNLFEEKVKNCKVFILSNPHNPGGRVWTKEELQQMASICHKHNVIVISDEIHADLTLKPYRHYPFATVSKEAAECSITFMSPSKAFNTPGIISSYSIVPNDKLRATFNSYLTASELNQGNLFAYIVPVTAYSESGSDWLEQVCSYISDNIDFVDKYLTENMPIIKFIRPMASFLIFLDCRELNLSQPELENLFIEKAGLALNTGTMFGPEGKGFMRMNIATSRATIKEALDRIKAAIE